MLPRFRHGEVGHGDIGASNLHTAEQVIDIRNDDPLGSKTVTPGESLRESLILLGRQPLGRQGVEIRPRPANETDGAACLDGRPITRDRQRPARFGDAGAIRFAGRERDDHDNRQRGGALPNDWSRGHLPGIFNVG